MNNFLKRTISCLAAFLISTNANAIEKITFDTWSEYSDGTEFDIVLQGLILELKLGENLSFITSSAAGIQIDELTKEKKTTAKDLALYPKYNFYYPQDDGTPGFSLIVGTVLPTGSNFLSSPNTSYMAIGSFPMILLDEALSLEVQLGHRYIDVVDGENVNRLYWGVFAEAKIVDQYNVFTNIYTGSPFEIDVPSLSQEYGLSYNYNEHLKYKMLFGMQPELDGVVDADTTEYWGEIGLEIYFHYLD